MPYNKTILLKPSLSFALFTPVKNIFFAALIYGAGYYAQLYLALPYIAYASYGIIAIFYCIYIYRFVYIKSINYKITQDRIEYTRGVFSITTDNLEMYRIKDWKVRESFLLRLIRSMSISLDTSDKSHPKFEMIGIPKSNVHKVIGSLVETARKNKGVYEID